MINPFQPLYQKCNVGDPAEKYRNLPKFPILIDVELTNSCNYRCLMCPTGNLSQSRGAGFMEEETHHRLVAQCAEHGTALRYISWGEPTLHPKIVDFVCEASSAGLLTHINSNGSKITPSLAEQLVGAGLSSIKLSFQGVDKATYLEMRRTDFFDGVLAAIKMMRTARGDKPLPFIAASTSTTHETQEMIEGFRTLLEPLVDHLSIGKTIFSFMDMNAVRLKKYEKDILLRLREFEAKDLVHPSPCPEVYTKLSVHFDGSTVLCCNDFNGTVDLGNINDTPISIIWRHPKIEEYRERLARNDYNAPLCSDCWDYQSLTGGN